MWLPIHLSCLYDSLLSPWCRCNPCTTCFLSNKVHTISIPYGLAFIAYPFGGERERDPVWLGINQAINPFFTSYPRAIPHELLHIICVHRGSDAHKVPLQAENRNIMCSPKFQAFHFFHWHPSFTFKRISDSKEEIIPAVKVILFQMMYSYVPKKVAGFLNWPGGTEIWRTFWIGRWEIEMKLIPEISYMV